MALLFPPSFSRLASLNLAARSENARLLELVDRGYRMDKLRAAASNETYRITPPVWADLDVNPNHKPPLPVDGQAGRQRGRRQTKRKRSNGEYATSSRVFALHQSRSNGQGAAVSGAVAAAATAHANAMSASLSQGHSQGQQTDRGGPSLATGVDPITLD